MTDQRKIKDEIISFVQDSTEEVNSKIAVFIAGMQAQKNLTDCRRKKDRGSFRVEKTVSAEKQGG